MSAEDQVQAPQEGVKCPNCEVRTKGLKIQQRRVRTKSLGVGFWLATICTFGVWALIRAVMGRKQLVRAYKCPSCRYEWAP